MDKGHSLGQRQAYWLALNGVKPVTLPQVRFLERREAVREGKKPVVRRKRRPGVHKYG
jgi:hypothetical protein